VIIRQAEPRDVTAIVLLFHGLLEYLRECGQWLYNPDLVEFANGVTGYIIGKMYHEGSRVLVSEDAVGKVNGFLIGEIVHYPMFFKYQKVGEIQWTSPLRMRTRDLARAFEAWAAEQGATGGGNYATPGNETSIKAMEHHGLRLAFYHFFKPYDKE